MSHALDLFIAEDTFPPLIRRRREGVFIPYDTRQHNISSKEEVKNPTSQLSVQENFGHFSIHLFTKTF